MPPAALGSWEVHTKWPFDAAEAKRRQTETAKALGVPVEQDIDLGNGVKMTLVLIPAGEFMMGSPEKPTPEETARLYGGERAWYEDEGPEHRVRLTTPFWIGKYEVTQSQWKSVMRTDPSRCLGAGNPVEQVSWEDCQVFLNKLNQRRARGAFGLPTEAQWEYACRAGAAAQFHFGNAAGALSDYGWWTGNAEGRAHPVGCRKPNPWSLYDMTGNLWEWCNDWYGSYAEHRQVDPRGASDGSLRVKRGGCWHLASGSCRSADRDSGPPSRRTDQLGFRVVMAVAPSIRAGTTREPRTPPNFEPVSPRPTLHR